MAGACRRHGLSPIFYWTSADTDGTHPIPRLMTPLATGLTSGTLLVAWAASPAPGPSSHPALGQLPEAAAGVEAEAGSAR